ncbi:hypothetical protein BC834DRAFT_259944 [Gloeopeniophorella convolvens]|nr:hypothetical protein BC834DRAFT_259944 [Gloeopeniophorella convolvens]
MVQQTLIALLCLAQLRAVYKNNKRVLLLVLPACGVGVIIICFGMYVTVEHMDPSIESSAFLLGYCPRLANADEGIGLSIVWLGALAIDTFVFILTLHKVVSDYPGRLLEIIFRNGIMYYTVIFFAYLSNILTLWFAPPTLRVALTGLTNALSSVLISRVFINLRSEWTTPAPLHFAGQMVAPGAAVIKTPFEASPLGRPPRRRLPEQTPTADVFAVTNTVMGSEVV